MSTKLLEKELATYEHKRDELLAKAKGKFVLIKDDEVVDVFDSQTNAIRRGYDVSATCPFS